MLGILLGALATAAGAADTIPGWQQVGWGGGAFYFTAAWHPTDANVVYLGSDCAGVYRSEDKGLHWRFTNHGVAGYAVYSSAVSTAAPDQIYVMTEDGMSRSTDRGQTWTILPETVKSRLDIRPARSGTVRAVAIDPKQADVVYAGSHTGKLFKSTDAGSVWTELPYRDAMPPVAGGGMFLGAGALNLSYDSQGTGSHSIGRVSAMYGDGPKAKDWSAYKRLTAHFRVPEGAPAALQAQFVVQCGDSWKWQEGAWAEAQPNGWVEVTLDLSKIVDVASVRMVHFQLRTLASAWKGEVQLDALTLHAAADGTVAAGVVPTAPESLLLADFEKKSETDGWSANRSAKDALCITAAVQSAGAKVTNIVSSVAIAAAEPATVYVSNTKLGVFRSDDGGATWTALAASPRTVASVTVSQTDPAVVWAAAGKAGLFRSTDRGVTWTRSETSGAGAGDKLDFREAALHPAKPDLVYAIANIGWGGFLYRSEDAGQTWSRSNRMQVDLIGNPTLPGDNGNGGKFDGTQTLSSVTNIAVNPHHADELFISANWRNVFSSDGGRTLEERSQGADNTCTTDIQFLDGKVYATAMDEGLLVADENNSGVWRQLIPLKYDANLSGHFWRVRAVKDGAGVRVVTTSSAWDSFSNPKLAGRVSVSTDGGKTFATATGLPDYVPAVNCMWGRSHPRALAVDPNDSKIMYVGLDGDAEPALNKPGGGIFRSTDGGLSWTRCAGQPGSRRIYYGLVVDPSNSQRLFWSACGTEGGLWRSEDSGNSWQHVFSADTWSFNVDIAPSGMVLMAGKDLQCSRDHGATWQPLTHLSGAASIVGIAIDPKNEKRFWISRTTWDSSPNGEILRTVDGGETWTDITGDIPFRKPQILRFNQATGDLWAAGVGIFKIAQPR